MSIFDLSLVIARIGDWQWQMKNHNRTMENEKKNRKTRRRTLSRFAVFEMRLGLVPAAVSAATVVTAAISATATAATTAAAATAAEAAAAATATTAAAAAKAAEPAAARRTAFARTRFVDGQCATIEFTAMEILDRGIRRFLRFHFDEGETARTSRVTIRHDACGFDRADLGKNFFQILL